MGTASEHDSLGGRQRSEAGSFGQYLREISVRALLTREEEAGLAARIRVGDRGALDHLVAANLRFVVAVAKRYQGHGLPLADLVNEGNVGLIRAAERFDETRGVRFISYAVWWIRQAILQAINDQAQMVRVPQSRAERSQRAARTRDELAQSLGRPPTHEEIAELMEVTPAQVRDALAARATYVSLDAPVGNAPEGRLAELIPDGEGSVDDGAERQAMQAAVLASLSCLPDRERLVLRLYFGLEGTDPMTLEEIGAQLCVTRERVRQIKERALARLRHGTRGQRLRSFFA